MAKYTKVDDENIREDYTEVKTVSNIHSIKFLKQQKLRVKDDIALLQLEVEKINNLIQEAKNLGVE